MSLFSKLVARARYTVHTPSGRLSDVLKDTVVQITLPYKINRGQAW